MLPFYFYIFAFLILFLFPPSTSFISYMPFLDTIFTSLSRTFFCFLLYFYTSLCHLSFHICSYLHSPNLPNLLIPYYLRCTLCTKYPSTILAIWCFPYLFTARPKYVNTLFCPLHVYQRNFYSSIDARQPSAAIYNIITNI